MKKNILLILFIGLGFIGCDKLAKEDTPVCKDCYQMKFKNNLPKDTLKYQRLCGGDVVVWENIPDSNSVVDTTVVQFFCK